MKRIQKMLLVSTLSLLGTAAVASSSYAAPPLASAIYAPIAIRPIRSPIAPIAADTFKEVADTVKAMVAGAHFLPISNVALAASAAF